MVRIEPLNVVLHNVAVYNNINATLNKDLLRHFTNWFPGKVVLSFACAVLFWDFTTDTCPQ
jgi:hypothetical protein